MSRGGRGGFRGGGGFGNSSSKLNSGNIPFDISAEVDDAYEKLAKDAELFPVCFRIPMNDFSLPARFAARLLAVA